MAFLSEPEEQKARMQDIGFSHGAGIAVGFGSVSFASANSLVVLLAPESGKVKATSVSGSSPSGIAVDPNAVWVANRASNNVYEFSPSTHQPTDDGTVSRIDSATNRVTKIKVGNDPEGVAVYAGRVWVSVQAP